MPRTRSRLVDTFDARELKRRLIWLMAARLLVASLLLGGTLLLSLNEERGTSSFTPRFLLTLILSTYGASLVFALWMPRAKHLGRLASVQLGWDLALTTGLVYVAGGAASGFTFLYGVSVLAGALVIGPRAAQLTTVSALVLYMAVGLLLTNGALPFPPDQPQDRYILSSTDATFTMLVNILGLLLVAVLASTLATRLRTTGGQLREAAAQTALLVRLNEDIVRSLSSGLLTTDTRGLVRSVNPAGLDIFAATIDQLVGRPVSELFSVNTASEGPIRAEGRGLRADGSSFPLGFTKTPLLDARSTKTGELFLFQDLTEVTELRKAAERAERLAALGRLAAALAHEIRNPLGSISGSVQIVREATSDPEDNRLLGIVLSEVDRLDTLVTSMLQVGRPKDPQRLRVDLVALTKEVVEVASGSHTGRRTTIALGACAPQVYADIDSDQIRQVIWNLLNNALVHSPEGSTIRIDVNQLDGTAVWTIADEGPGIPKDAREHLFDMLYSKRPHGVGLGLALVDQLVRAHGGTIQVTSGDGPGATFELRLPLAAPA